MSLLKQINTDLKEAMKEKETEKLSTLRMLITDIKNTQIEKQKELTDEEILRVISRQVKQRNDSIAQYKEGKREELAKKEEQEKQFLLPYLPAQLSKEEIQTIIKEAIKESGASGPADFGNVAKRVMPKLKGKADTKLVSEQIKKQLGS